MTEITFATPYYGFEENYIASSKTLSNIRKITFATPYYISGFGIENRITELVRNLPSDIKKQIICLRQKRSPPRGVKVYSLPRIIHTPTTFKPMHFSAWSKIVRNSYFKLFLRNSDIIDAQYFPMTYLPKTSKLVITWHSVTFPEYAENPKEARLMNNEYFFILNNMYKADMVIPVSKWAENEIKNFDNSIPTNVVPNGVDLNKFRFKPLDKRKKTIICVGRFVPHKGHLEAINIFKEVISDLKDFEINLILVGASHNEGYLKYLKNYANSVGIPKIDIPTTVSSYYNIPKEKALELIMNSKNLLIPDLNPSITYLTNVDDIHMPSIYHLGDIFISCSHWEGFGMPMLEAQACGLPALGYNICSHPEVVSNKNFLAEENDIWTIAENVKKLLTDKEFYDKSSIEARKFAENFSWNNITRKYIDVIEKL